MGNSDDRRVLPNLHLTRHCFCNYGSDLFPHILCNLTRDRRQPMSEIESFLIMIYSCRAASTDQPLSSKVFKQEEFIAKTNLIIHPGQPSGIG
jgi:hypothetical protein